MSKSARESGTPTTTEISAKDWLASNGYPELLDAIVQLEGRWAASGKKTRRNWWAILAGARDGSSRIVDGISFPVLGEARRRQGLPPPKSSEVEAELQPSETMTRENKGRTPSESETERIIEEYEDNEPTGVEAELEGSSRSTTKPYNPTKIRVDPKTFSIRQIMDMIDDGDLDLAPDFQRKRVWKPREKSRLIESILLRIPLPAFYFSADSSGRLRVVDGLQRLSTVHEFARGGADTHGGFMLRDLEYLEDGVVDKRYGDLDQVWTRRIQQTQIFVNVIDPQTPTQVKFDIFKRLNTGGVPLNAQEIRHCMSSKRSRDFLKVCIGGYYGPDENMLSYEEYAEQKGPLARKIYLAACEAAEKFGEATNWAMWNHIRMADREVILRFCAFRLIVDNLDRYSESKSMDDFLTETTEQLDDKSSVSDKVLLDLADKLSRAMDNASALFGDFAFRKWRTSDNNRNPINRALFESWAVVLADYDWSTLEPHRGKIVKAARRHMTKTREYIDAISTGTGDPAKVKLRFEMARRIIEEAIA